MRVYHDYFWYPDPDQHFLMRIRIRIRANDPDPTGSGSETLLIFMNEFLVRTLYYSLRRVFYVFFRFFAFPYSLLFRKVYRNRASSQRRDQMSGKLF